MTEYGYKLNQYRNLRKAKGIEATRRSIIDTNEINKAEQRIKVPVKFPRIGPNDVIVSRI